MNVNQRTSVIIPAYNEEKGLTVVLARLDRIINSRQMCPDELEIIVVNDGSSDKTVEITAKYPYKIVSHPKNLGKGQAMRTGVANSQGQNIIFIDADGTYPVEEIPHIIEQLRNYDAVFTVRQQKNIPALNLIGNQAISAVIRIFFGSVRHDNFSGLYGIKRSVMEKLDIESAGFSIEAEIAVKTAVMGFKITEIHIKYERRLGQSKLKPFKDGPKILKLIFLLMVRHNLLRTFILSGIFLQ